MTLDEPGGAAMTAVKPRQGAALQSQTRRIDPAPAVEQLAFAHTSTQAINGIEIAARTHPDREAIEGREGATRERPPGAQPGTDEH
jgi:hypothetical protein